MNRKEQQLLRQRQTTRQLMGVTRLTEHGAVCGRDELLFYLLRPDNLSILSPKGIRGRVRALTGLLQGMSSLERLALDSIRFYYGGRCAVMFITTAMVACSGAGENDMEGLAPISRQIEGVWVGVTLRQKPDGSYKVSVRTGTHADAAAICARLGGGGHVRAAGCSLTGTAEEAVNQLLAAVRDMVPAITDHSVK